MSQNIQLMLLESDHRRNNSSISDHHSEIFGSQRYKKNENNRSGYNPKDPNKQIFLANTGILDCYEHVISNMISEGWPSNIGVFEHAANLVLDWEHTNIKSKIIKKKALKNNLNTLNVSPRNNLAMQYRISPEKKHSSFKFPKIGEGLQKEQQNDDQTSVNQQLSVLSHPTVGSKEPPKIILKSRKSKNLSLNPINIGIFREPDRLIGIKDFYKKNKSFGDDYFRKMMDQERRQHTAPSTEPQLTEKGVPTELNAEQLKYMYDLGRMSRNFGTVLKELNDTTLVKLKGKQSNLSWKDGLMYDRDLAEIVLPEVDRIVVPHVLQYKRYEESVSNVHDKDQLPYSSNALAKSITKIFQHIYQEMDYRDGQGPKTQQRMSWLKQQVVEAMDTQNIYMNQLQKVKNAHLMILAILFWSCNYQADNGLIVHDDICSQILQKNPGEAIDPEISYITQKLAKEIQFVKQWVHKALMYIHKHRGICNFEVRVPDPAASLAYFQPGKICGFHNFIQAQMGSYEKRKRQDLNANLVIHIFSKTARRIIDFVSSGTELENQLGDDVIFPRNCHFLVCKRVEDRVQGRVHIYLREMTLGIADRVVIWLDHQSQQQFHIRNFFKDSWTCIGGTKISEHILLMQSFIALAYFRSKFFVMALQLASSFKFVQNLNRDNENVVHILPDEKVADEFAGAKLLHDFAKLCAEGTYGQQFGPKLLQKVETAIYIRDYRLEKQQGAMEPIIRQNFQEFGIGRDKILDSNDWRLGRVQILQNMQAFAEFANVHQPETKVFNATLRKFIYPQYNLSHYGSDKHKRPYLQ